MIRACKGGLNKTEIQALAVKSGLSPNGTRNELLRQLCHGRKMGWSVRAPNGVPARRKMLHLCGPACFLNPEKLKFPVCADDGRCRLDRTGLIAAKKRAAQWGYTKEQVLAEKRLSGWPKAS